MDNACGVSAEEEDRSLDESGLGSGKDLGAKGVHDGAV